MAKMLSFKRDINELLNRSATYRARALIRLLKMAEMFYCNFLKSFLYFMSFEKNA